MQRRGEGLRLSGHPLLQLGGATGVIEYYTNDVDDVDGTTSPDPSTLHIGVRVAF